MGSRFAPRWERDWFTFQPGSDADETEVHVHPSKKLAVRDAQYSGCTDKRPKKIGSGHYELFGCGGHQYWIVAQRVMEEEFPELMKQAYDDAA
jgi:hypothetical protein